MLQPSMGLQTPMHVDRRVGLRDDIRRVQAERVGDPAPVLKAPAPVVVPLAVPAANASRQLTPGQHEELRQQLRQQQIENMRQRP